EATTHSGPADPATIQIGWPSAARIGYDAMLAPVIASTMRARGDSGAIGGAAPSAGASSASTSRKHHASAAYETSHPTIATGIMCSAYALRSIPARVATTRFIGLPVGSGAT